MGNFIRVDLRSILLLPATLFIKAFFRSEMLQDAKISNEV